MIFLTYVQNLATIGPVVSKITCLVKMDLDTRQTETRDYFFRTLGVTKRRVNVKVAIRQMDSITILP